MLYSLVRLRFSTRTGYATSVELFNFNAVFSRSACTNRMTELGTVAKSYVQSTWYVKFRRTLLLPLQSDGLKQFVYIQSKNPSSSSTQNYILYSILKIWICLFRTWTTLFCNIEISPAADLYTICTSSSILSAFRNISMELSRNSSRRDAALFKLPGVASSTRLLQWRSSLIFYAYLSTSLLNRSMHRNAQSKKAHIVWPCSISSQV